MMEATVNPELQHALRDLTGRMREQKQADAEALLDLASGVQEQEKKWRAMKDDVVEEVTESARAHT